MVYEVQKLFLSLSIVLALFNGKGMIQAETGESIDIRIYDQP